MLWLSVFAPRSQVCHPKHWDEDNSMFLKELATLYRWQESLGRFCVRQWLWYDILCLRFCFCFKHFFLSFYSLKMSHMCIPPFESFSPPLQDLINTLSFWNPLFSKTSSSYFNCILGRDPLGLIRAAWRSKSGSWVLLTGTWANLSVATLLKKRKRKRKRKKKAASL